MPFDDPTRNELQRIVGKARDVLVEEFTSQCQRVYGIQPDGSIFDLSKLDHLPQEEQLRARLLRDRLHHLSTGIAGPKAQTEAVARLLREESFTVLNRLCALRMCEERELVQECVRAGYDSKGFRLFDQTASKLGGETYQRYVLFLQNLFDELSVDLGILFDRFALVGLLFPGENAFKQVLVLVNTPKLSRIWADDEAVGWVYQYFNAPEERREMRESSPAPQNSRELAVRNQFFTPRYVVEFLADNTLGRIWYEMRRGATVLKEECRYLMRRPNEVFLAAGNTGPVYQENGAGNLSQEELLSRPVYVDHRAPKDPRDLRILDPACGSGHFLLYTFDLLERIYEEAWGDPESPKSEISGRTLRETYATVDELRRAVPKLVVEHNLHGVDIDPRAVQIAVLALWLRAQKTWKHLSIAVGDRPQISKSNVVAAEPMPGDADMRREFTESITPRVLGQLVDVIYEKMRLAGEVGSLLRIDEEIKDAVAVARTQWIDGPKQEQAELFPDLVKSKPEQRQLRFDLTGVTDEQFWEQAEDRIIAALRQYAEQIESGQVTSRRLFAEDAARGFAFIDLLKKRFDVVLMNPPFGDGATRGNKLLLEAYPVTNNDLYAMFFERSFGLLNARGKVGAISNRTWFGLPTFEGLRTQVFGRLGSIECAADLGSFVLDAQVETASVVAGKATPSTHTAVWIRLLKTKKKEPVLFDAVNNTAVGIRHTTVYLSSLSRFSSMPTAVFGYWMSDRLIAAYSAKNSIGAKAAEVKQGTATADDFRFLRLAWEVPAAEIGPGRTWLPFAKGGEYAPYFDDIHLLLRWTSSGKEVIAWGKGRPQNTQYFGRTGITWPRRTTSAFSPRPMPSGCAFGDKGPSAFPLAGVAPEVLLAVIASRPIRLLLSVRLGAGDDAPGSASKSYEVGLVRDLPFPNLDAHLRNELGAASLRCSALRLLDFLTEDQTAALFSAPPLLKRRAEGSLKDLAAIAVADREDHLIEYSELTAQIDDHVATALAFSLEDRLVMSEELEPPVAHFTGQHPIDPEAFRTAYLTKEAIPGELLPGGVQAESDVRIATRRKQQSASLRSDEVMCRLFELPPRRFAEIRRSLGLLRAEDIRDIAEGVLAYVVGIAMGRFDIRIGLADLVRPSDVYSARPVCAPGMLVGPDGLPAESGRIASEEWLRAKRDANTLPPERGFQSPVISDVNYPAQVAWRGILVDDPGPHAAQPHQDDVICRARAVLELLWQEKSHAIEQEISGILGISDLRDYFRKPSGFFQDHLTRYSKSRRKAPVYLPLSTDSGDYTIWLYYPRLSEQTLYTCVNDYLDPKLADIEKDVDRFRGMASPDRKSQEYLDDLRELQVELKTMRERLLKIAALPYKPNLNDGVLITAAPLWQFFRHTAWRNQLKGYWHDLSAEKYEWAHLAYAIWPERVRKVCKKDKSIAIAHGLEELYVG
jgi:hypothetical protein